MTFSEHEMKVMSAFGVGLTMGLVALLATNSFLAMAAAHFVGVILFAILIEIL